MPGMPYAPSGRDALVVSAFHATLLHQLLLLLAVGIGLALVWNVTLTARQRRGLRADGPDVPSHVVGGGAPDRTGTPGPGAAPLSTPEPAGRTLLRVAFGALWIADGLLQVQAGMPLGIPRDVVRPALVGAPHWVHGVVATGSTVWAHHPVEAAASVVWIQIGIGVALLVAPRGRWSRCAGATSAAWGLVVWVFGEAFGGIFSPGGQWAFGLPGAVLFYVVAGALISLPEREWRAGRLGRLVVRGVGLFFVGMAILQAWPGAGHWRGSARAPLAEMARTMARTSQPHWLSSTLSWFASLDAAHGWGVNLSIVAALGAVGVVLVAGHGRLLVAGTAAAAVLCFAAWMLVEDFGVLGGVGTDPNSMVPTVLLLVGGLVGVRRAPVATTEPVLVAWHALVRRGGAALLLQPRLLSRVAGGLLVVTLLLLGLVPLASASLNPRASALAIDGRGGAATGAPLGAARDVRGVALRGGALRGIANGPGT